MSKQVKHFYEFGAFRLYPKEGLLLRGGDTVRLTPKAYETLLLLVTNNGDVLDKDELMKKIWPDTIVEEVNLAKNISALRKILGEDGSEHQYIETLPKRGYRFVAPVRECWEESAKSLAENQGLSHAAGANEVTGGSEVKTEERSESERGFGEPSSFTESTTRETAGAPKRASAQRFFWIAALTGASLIAGTTWWLAARRPAPAPQASSQRVIPVTTFPGSESQPAISPDGKQVAFTWAGKNNDNWDIYVKLVDAGEPLRLTSETVIERNPVWSPDGRYIAYLRESPDGTGVSIYLVPSLGGGARKLTETYGLGFAWSPDGESLAVAERNSREEPFSLSLFSIKTGGRRKLTFPPAQSFGDINPGFSPDGRTLAFTRSQAGSMNSWDIYLVSVAGGEPERLTHDETLIEGLDWTADGREIIFSSSRSGGITALWRIAAAGGPPEPLAGLGMNAGSPSISRQGYRLAYTHSVADSNIWRVEVSRPQHTAASPAMLISSTLYDHSPEYSPDGERIAFASARSGSPEVWICNGDGSSPTQLTSFGGPATGNPRWSPDGRHIVFDSSSEGNADIFVIDVEGGSPRRLTRESSEDIMPRWSRGGRWIYFTSNRNGEFQIWKMSPDGGGATQVTKQGGFEAVESPDGKYLYYAKGRTTSGIWRISVEGGEEAPILDALKAGYLRYWAAADQGIYFGTRATSPQPTIQFFNFATGKLTEVFRLEKPLLVGAPGLSISPDGRFILFAQIDRSDSDILLVDGFR